MPLVDQHTVGLECDTFDEVLDMSGDLSVEQCDLELGQSCTSSSVNSATSSRLGNAPIIVRDKRSSAEMQALIPHGLICWAVV